MQRFSCEKLVTNDNHTCVCQGGGFGCPHWGASGPEERAPPYIVPLHVSHPSFFHDPWACGRYAIRSHLCNPGALNVHLNADLPTPEPLKSASREQAQIWCLKRSQPEASLVPGQERQAGSGAVTGNSKIEVWSLSDCPSPLNIH